MYQRDYSKTIFLDFETAFASNSQPDWKFENPIKRLLTYKIGDKETKVVDFWKDFPNKELLSSIQSIIFQGVTIKLNPSQHYRNKLALEPLLEEYNKLTFENQAYKEIEEALKEGYHLVGQNIIGFDCLYPLIPPTFLDYIAEGALFDTMVAEQIINGLTTPLERHIKSTTKIDDETLEEEEVEEEMSGNSLEDLAWRYTKTALNKKYQHASFYKKLVLPEEVLKYAKMDVLILDPIYKAQVDRLKELKLEQMMNFSMELHLTTYIAHWKGVYIDTEKLESHTKRYEEIYIKQKEKVESLLPDVEYTEPQLIELFLKGIWTRGGIYGVTNKTNATKILSQKQNHTLYNTYVRWKDTVGASLRKRPKITNPAHRKYCFNKLGYKIPDTKDGTIRSYILNNEAPILEEYLKYQESNSLLTKTLYKFNRQYYLRKDNTIPTKYKMVRPTNWRTASSEVNIQQLSKDLKDLYGCPPGMSMISLDFSGIELFMLLQDYPESDLIRVMLDDKASDLHCFLASRYFSMDYLELLSKKLSGDKTVKPIRNASKTTTYFNIYKSPSDPSKNFITGANKLISIFESDLGEKKTKQEAEIMLNQAESSFSRWTAKKRQIQQLIIQAYQAKKQVITAKGPLGHRSIFRVSEGKAPLYSIDDYGNPYINERSLSSCAIAGKVAVAAKEALRRLQLDLYKSYGPDKSYCPLFIHDSFDCYCLPELAEEVFKKTYTYMLEAMHEIAGFKNLPVRVEGNIVGRPVETWEITAEGVIRKI